MLRRLVGLVALAWVLGFAVFTLALPGPAGDRDTTDGLVVPTGGPGRIERGLALMRAHVARRMLVTGVAPGVDADDLSRRYPGNRPAFTTTVDLGNDAVDTRSNAAEAARWVRANGFHSVRLVTSDWHVRRARMELEAALGPGVVVVADGVRGEASLRVLVSEYDKLLVRWAALRWAPWR
jgi:uncharacterized SAM-binding protein YcdF (DUF218 family)